MNGLTKNQKDKPREDGAATVQIELADGRIRVMHGVCGSVLIDRAAYAGEWDEIFTLLRREGGRQ